MRCVEGSGTARPIGETATSGESSDWFEKRRSTNAVRTEDIVVRPDLGSRSAAAHHKRVSAVRLLPRADHATTGDSVRTTRTSPDDGSAVQPAGSNGCSETRRKCSLVPGAGVQAKVSPASLSVASATGAIRSARLASGSGRAWSSAGVSSSSAMTSNVHGRPA